MRSIQHPPEESLAAAGEVLREEIRQRALSGLSFTGEPFAPYSDEYARRKGQTNVDLYSKKMPPHMLDAIQVKVGQDEIEIGIFGDEVLAERARVNNEGASIRTAAGRKAGRYTSLKARRAAVALGRSLFAKIPARPWLGLTQQALDKVGKAIVKDMRSAA